MFSNLAKLTVDHHDKGLVPYIGGDFNTRVGDFSSLGNNNTWNYEANTISNKHGRTYFCDLCAVTKIKPLNGLKCTGKVTHNNFTFFGGRRNSQIDFALTNNAGRKNLNSFNILKNDWHISDHAPISLQIELSSSVDLTGLLMRSSDLNYMPCDMKHEVKQFKGACDNENIERELMLRKDILCKEIDEKLQEGDLDGGITILNTHINAVHKKSKIRTPNNVPNVHNIEMENANMAFHAYLKAIEDNNSDEVKTQALERYKTARKAISKSILMKDTKMGRCG